MAVQSVSTQTISMHPGYLRAKRVLDITFTLLISLFLLLVSAVVAVLIVLDSKGPILYRQRRVGQNGAEFELLKFRSMYIDNDDTTHREAVKQYMNGEKLNGDGNLPYKKGDDPRITRVGRFIRKTSLDELPQFWNVLRGDMSLVGPRPSLDYEYRAYELWHRRRVLEIKPGITGLWQVEGRSRTRFDDMVRLDLKYARVWSVWLDLRILAQTPAAVIQGTGAH